jgi:hypothetical protein
VWYTTFIKEALRKHNLRIDFRVYPGEEESFLTDEQITPILKSLLSSAIIKGLDIIAIVSKFGMHYGKLADQISKNSGMDIKVIPGEDYYSSDKFQAVFFNLQQDIPKNLPIDKAISQVKQQGGKVMIYNCTRSQAKLINKWKGTSLQPDFVEVYNSKYKAFRDLDIDASYPLVISSSSRTANELEKAPVYTELSRKQLIEIGILQESEGVDFKPKYLNI